MVVDLLVMLEPVSPKVFSIGRSYLITESSAGNLMIWVPPPPFISASSFASSHEQLMLHFSSPLLFHQYPYVNVAGGIESY